MAAYTSEGEAGMMNQHMTELVFIQVVHHRGECGRLARTGGAGAKHQAARLERQLGKYLGGVELLKRQDLGRNRTEHRAGAAVLVERIDAKTRQPLDLERKVALERFLISFSL